MAFAWLFWIDEGNPSIMIWRVILCVATCCRCVRRTTIFFNKVNYISLIQHTSSNLREVTIDQPLFRCVGKLAKNGLLAFFMSVHLSAWNDSFSTGRIFIKFDIWVLFEKVSIKNKFSLGYDKNNGCFTFKTNKYK